MMWYPLVLAMKIALLPFALGCPHLEKLFVEPASWMRKLVFPHVKYH